MFTSTAGPDGPANKDAIEPDVVLIDTKSVVGRWQVDDRERVLHQHNKLEISYNATQSTAYLMFHTMITLRALPSRTKVGLVLFIDPERVQSISLDESTSTPLQPDIRAALGTTAWCLHLELRRPADLIVPQLDLVPRSKAGFEAMEGLRTLAQSTKFDLLFSHRASSKSDLARLCAAFATCTRNPQQPQLARMYHGRGGIILDPVALPAPRDERDEPEGNPPSYDEIGPGPPMPPVQSDPPGLWRGKRKRSDSDELSSFHVPAPAQSTVEAACRKVFEQLKAELKSDLRTELKAELQAEIKAEIQTEIKAELQTELRAHTTRAVEERIGAGREEKAAPGTTETAATSDLQALEGQRQGVRDEIMEAVQEELGDLEERLTDQIDSLRREIEDHVDIQVEENCLSARIELESFVHDEVRNAEARIRQRLQARAWTTHIDLQLQSDSDNS